MNRKPYTIREIRFITDNYQSMTQAELGKALNRTAISIKNKVGELCLRKEVNRGKFAANQQPWNKGKEHKTTSSTQFKKGDMPVTAKPESQLYKRNDRYAVLWYVRPTGKRRTMPYHRHRWEQMYGEVPSGHVVSFKDGDTMNIADENLVLKSRAQLMAENKAKCDSREAGLRAWRTRSGLSLVDEILQCRW